MNKLNNQTKTPGELGQGLGKLAHYCARYWPAMAVSVVLALAGAVFSLIGPNQLSKVTDYITAGIMGSIDLGAIGRVGLLLAVLYAAGFLMRYLQGFIMATVVQRVSKGIRGDISKKISRVPLKYFDSVAYGDILSRVTNDVDTVAQTLNSSATVLVSAVTMLLGSLAMMLATNWIMALAAVASIILGFGIMAFIMSRSQKHFVARQASLGELNGYVEELYSGHEVVRSSNAAEQVNAKFDGLNKRVHSANWKSQFLSGLMMPLMFFIGNLGYAVVCLVGAVLAMNGTISFGVIVAFMLYIRMFTNPLNQLAQGMTNLQTAAAASKRLFDFLGQPELEDESHVKTKLTQVKGDVEFKNARFGYSPDKIIVKDFSLAVKAGQKVAIVGPTGAGKTTMVNLLMRFYELNSGEILIDGVPVSELTREDVHSLFGMVLQDTWLFEGTVRENLVYNTPGVTEKAMKSACRACGVHNFIMTLPKGYDTVLNDSASVSAGQKQLLTIARTMIQGRPMLILDEATSSVDTRTEAITQRAMDQLAANRTSFVIAHRLSTIKNADLILVMRDGDIVEKGSHDQLMEQKGFYAQLYQSQFEPAAA